MHSINAVWRTIVETDTVMQMTYFAQHWLRSVYPVNSTHQGFPLARERSHDSVSL